MSDLFDDNRLFQYVPREEHENFMKQIKENCIVRKPSYNVISSDDSSKDNNINKEQHINYIIQTIIRMNWLIRYKFKFYMLFGLTYVPLDEDYFMFMIYEFGTNIYHGIEYSDVFKIFRTIKMCIPDYEGDPDDERYTLVLNGYIENSTGSLYQFVSGYFPTVCINANYIPFGEVHHPIFDAFLNRLCEGDKTLVKRMWEVLGYAISSDTQAKRFFLLIGETGNNGKSTWLEFLENLLSDNSVSHMSMGNLFNGRYAQSELFLKRLNISSDEGYCKLNDEQIGELKRLTGGKDKITSDVKNRSQISFKPTCKLFLASNYNLSVSYASSGEAIINRICTIPFNAVITNEEKDPFIIEKLMTEKDSIVTEAIRHYVDVRRRAYSFTGDDIYDSKTISPSGGIYNDVIDFCDRYCNFDSAQNFTFTIDLFEVFKVFYNPKELDITAFSQCFKKVCETQGYFVKNKRKRLGNRNQWGYYGVVIQLTHQENDYVQDEKNEKILRMNEIE